MKSLRCYCPVPRAAVQFTLATVQFPRATVQFLELLSSFLQLLSISSKIVKHYLQSFLYVLYNMFPRATVQFPLATVYLIKDCKTLPSKFFCLFCIICFIKFIFHFVLYKITYFFKYKFG